MDSTPFKNSLFGVCMLLSGLFLLHTAYSNPYAGVPGEDPMFFPRLLLWPWVGISAIICVTDGRRKQRIVPALRWGPLCTVALLLIASAELMPRIGFVPVAFPFFLLYARITGYRNWRALVPIALLFTVAVWGLFNFVLEIQLPGVPFF